MNAIETKLEKKREIINKEAAFWNFGLQRVNMNEYINM